MLLFDLQYEGNLQIKRLQVTMDKVAIGFSVLCAIHCMILPVALTIIPILIVTPLGNENFHQFMIWLVLPTSSLAFHIGMSSSQRFDRDYPRIYRFNVNWAGRVLGSTHLG